MENNKCDCSKCEHWDECEIGLIVHNPIKTVKISSLYENDDYKDMVTDVCSFPFIGSSFTINKGDKIAQCTLMEHKGYLLGIESDTERSGGFGSTGGIR